MKNVKTVQLIKTDMNDWQALDKHKLNWELVDKEHIKVIFHAWFDDNYALLEAELNRAGLRAIRRTYDKNNNKTITIYKRTA